MSNDEGDELSLAVRWPDDDEYDRCGYSNIVSMNHTAGEFYLRFAHVVVPMSPPDSGEIQALPVALIQLGPSQMKRLGEFVADQISKYEARNGPIVSDYSE